MAITTLKKQPSLTKVVQSTATINESILEKVGEVAASYDPNNPSMILSAEPRLGVPADMEVGKVYPIQLDLSAPITLEWRKAATVDPNTGENWQYLAGAATVGYDGKTSSMPIDAWQLMGYIAQANEIGQLPDCYAKVVMQNRKTGNPVKAVELFSDMKCANRISINAEKFKAGEVEAIGFN